MPDFVVDFDAGDPPADARLDAEAFHRNHAPIWSVIAPLVQDRGGDALEVGSGTGQHVVEFARRSPAVTWWPSDLDPRHLASIAAWRAHARLANLRAPLRIDLAERDWDTKMSGPPPRDLLAVLCINVLHIAPWRVSGHLLAGAARQLRPDGRLFVYGPFKVDGAHTAPSNARFDASLRAHDPEWGVRDTRDLSAIARESGLRLAEIVTMPANNVTLAFTPIG